MTPPFHRTIIVATSPWKPIDLGQLVRYRDMLYFKVVNSYKAEHRQTVLSYLWVVIDPVFKIFFCNLLFGKIARIDTGPIPYLAFNASAVVAWNFLGASLNGSVSSLINEASLLQKIYIPRLFIPLVPCLTQVPNLFLNLVLTLGLLAWLGFWPTWALLGVIPLLLLMVVQATAVGFLLSSYALQYRDIRKFWSGVMQFVIYSAPVVYPLSAVPEKFRGWYMANPIAAVIEAFRDCLLGQPLPWGWVGLACVTSGVFLYLSMIVFRFREPLIVDAA